MTFGKPIFDKQGGFWSWGPRGDVTLIWGLFCACYWLYPLWPRGKVSWDLKFAILVAYTFVFLALIYWWNRTARYDSNSLVQDPAPSSFSTPWGIAAIGVLATAGVLQSRG